MILFFTVGKGASSYRACLFEVRLPSFPLTCDDSQGRSPPPVSSSLERRAPFFPLGEPQPVLPFPNLLQSLVLFRSSKRCVASFPRSPIFLSAPFFFPSMRARLSLKRGLPPSPRNEPAFWNLHPFFPFCGGPLCFGTRMLSSRARAIFLFPPEDHSLVHSPSKDLPLVKEVKFHHFAGRFFFPHNPLHFFLPRKTSSLLFLFSQENPARHVSLETSSPFSGA